MARFGFCFGARRREEVAAYLPVAYEVLGEGMRDGRTFYVIGGVDVAGWTFDEYVVPRLASGLMTVEEVTEEAARAVVASSSRPDAYIGLPAAPAVDTVEALAGALTKVLEDDDAVDITALYEALAPVVSRPDFVRLGAALELCPDHYCDIRICADDDLHGDEVYAVEAPAADADEALVRDLVGWALEQDHDASGMGDAEYLYFLTDDDTPESIDAVREALNRYLDREAPVASDTVYVVLTLDENPFQTEVEVLSSAPRWDLDAAGQIVFAAGVNGGDSRRWLGPDDDNQDEIDAAIAAEEVRLQNDPDDPRP